MVCVKINKFTFLLTTFLMISLYSLILSGCEEETDVTAKLDEFMTAFNENCSYKYSGTILVAKGNEILLNKGYGMANYEEKIPNETDNVFAIGSLSKSFTAVAIMQLAEKGLLNVNDSVSKYIDGVKRGDDISIHQLLTHTSGLMRDYLRAGSQEVSLEENIKFINGKPLLFEPGLEYSYSNGGYIILAAIIEKVSGKSYNEYIRDNIFIPLKMNSSRGGKDELYVNNQAVGYKILKDDPVKLFLINFSCITGCGNIYSTVEDLYKYNRALFDGKLLRKESLNTMFTAYLDSNYGYGWGITERSGQREIIHSGHIDGYYSSFIRYPEADYVLIFLTNNTDNTALDVVSETMKAIIFEETYVIPKKTDIKVDSEDLKQYAGEYDFGEGMLILVTFKNGKLYSTADDGNLYEFLPITETSFHYEDHQWIKGEFLKDKDNNEMTLKIQNINRSFEGKKLY